MRAVRMNNTPGSCAKRGGPQRQSLLNANASQASAQAVQNMTTVLVGASRANRGISGRAADHALPQRSHLPHRCLTASIIIINYFEVGRRRNRPRVCRGSLHAGGIEGRIQSLHFGNVPLFFLIQSFHFGNVPLFPVRGNNKRDHRNKIRGWEREESSARGARGR